MAEDVGADLVVAAPIYFHRAAPGNFEIYGADILVSRYAGGVPSNTGKMVVTARGPRVLVKKDGRTHAARAHPATGCFSFIAPVEGPFMLFVSDQHEESYRNRTIVRNRDGMQLAWSKTIDPPKGKTPLMLVGNYDPNATLAAMSGFAM